MLAGYPPTGECAEDEALMRKRETKYQVGCRGGETRQAKIDALKKSTCVPSTLLYYSKYCTSRHTHPEFDLMEQPFDVRGCHAAGILER